MTLASGTRLGPYEITAALGAGGMGEVYRARDTRLNRDVALKILPEAFATDPDRLARFNREAQVLASVNHPNIAAIYGAEESESLHALVLELVEGPTLADRIAHGPVPLDEALPIAHQIAEALEAAHEYGIIHRDLKPANIKLRPDGAVKVLDFGLAKALEPAPTVGADVTASPTITSPAMMTGAGMILGTAAYMAPEQAKGRPATKRSDIWAFGCVLYEMLTGRRAFDGSDVSDALAAVLRAEVDLNALPRSIPTRIRHVLNVCLKKNPQERAADIHDIRLALEGAFEPDTRTDAVHSPESRRSRPWIAGGLLAASLAIGLFGWWMGYTADAPPRPVRRFAITLPPLLRPALGQLVALSPDGNTLAFRATEGQNTRFYWRRLDQLDPTPISGTEDASGSPFFSPDGEWLWFRSGNTLMKVARAGGRPVRVGALPNAGLWRGAWDADGTVIVGAGPSGLARLSAEGGEIATILEPTDGLQFWSPQILPGGRAVLFTVSAGAVDAGEVSVLDLETGMRRTLVPAASAGQYVPTGHLLFVRGEDLWAVRFDPGRLEVIGEPVVVVQGVLVNPAGYTQMAISDEGSLAYLPSRGTARRVLVSIDRQGGEKLLNTPPRNYDHIRLSPDGTRVALTIREEGADIWIWDLVRETLARLTSGSSGEFPVWTPDGKRVAFVSRGTVAWRLADASGGPEQLTSGQSLIAPSAFSPDGSQLLLSETRAPFNVYRSATGTRIAPTGLLMSPYSEASPELSPDGRWLAYQSDESGRSEVYVRPFPDVNAGRWVISTAGGTTPLWRRDGRELFYLADSGTVMAVPISSAPGGLAAGRPQTVVRGSYQASGELGYRNYDVSPDGKRFLMVKDVEGEAASFQIILVQNWFEELKRLVPVD